MKLFITITNEAGESLEETQIELHDTPATLTDRQLATAIGSALESVLLEIDSEEKPIKVH